MNKTEKNFYLEVKADINHFSQYAIQDIRGERQEIKYSDIKESYEKIRKLNLSDDALKNLEEIIKDAITGAVHSIFVSIDGGTALSSEGKALDLIDRATGKPLTEGALHENFMEVLD